jgi:hypothetical protein
VATGKLLPAGSRTKKKKKEKKTTTGKLLLQNEDQWPSLTYQVISEFPAIYPGSAITA